MTRLNKAFLSTFTSLQVRNYRLFFFGTLVSMSGTWMQTVALGWLVLRLSGDGVAVGVNLALQFLPMLLFAMWGGIFADRFDKRRLLISTQSVLTLFALAFWLLTVTDAAQLWMIFALTFAMGTVSALEMPARQSFVTEMVGPERVTNAVSLNSAVFNGARIFGPALAGIVIETLGLSWAFLGNAVTYPGVIAAYALMRTSELYRQAPVPREKGQIRAGFRYVWDQPRLRYTLFLVAIVSGLGLNFSVVLPLMSRFVFHRGADAFGLLTSIMAGGSLLGALFSAARKRPTMGLLFGAAATFGVLELLAAAAPSIELLGLVLLPTGVSSILFIATANSNLQLNSSREMRGRVMAVYALLFLGTAPIGAPLVGWVAERWGPQAGFVLGGAVTLVTVAVVYALWRRERAALSARRDALHAGPVAGSATPARHPKPSRPGGSGRTFRRETARAEQKLRP
ncbi:MAG: MFS transporter [Actinomycetota bacterium]|nr:MFS transporter [Actinomycetota bacterium]